MTKSSVININNNMISKAGLLCDISTINALVSICDNSISNLDSCINYHKDNCNMKLTFNGNTCYNVKKLCNKVYQRIDKNAILPRITCKIVSNTFTDSFPDIYSKFKNYYDKSLIINITDNAIVNTDLEQETSIEDIAMLFNIAI